MNLHGAAVLLELQGVDFYPARCQAAHCDVVITEPAHGPAGIIVDHNDERRTFTFGEIGYDADMLRISVGDWLKGLHDA